MLSIEQHAEKAFQSWSKLTWEERAKHVREAGKGFRDLTPQLAPLLVAEQGKSTQSAKGEIAGAQRWFDRMPDMKIEERISYETKDAKVVERYVPLGVSAGIVPWNFPV